jgi:PilZ domain
MSHPLQNGSPPAGDELTFGPNRRKHRRYEVVWSGVIHLPDATHVECAILDLSADGARVILGQSLSADQQVFFVSPRFDTVTARIVWVDGPKAGLQFLDGIDRVLHVLSGKDGEILLVNEVLTLLRGTGRA